MTSLRVVLLMSNENGAFAEQKAEEAGLTLDAVVVNDLPALIAACVKSPELLLSFGTGTIVPQSILDIDGMLAINIHAAPPDYPGRDPHHFASYDGVNEYGATMHFMTARVDDGPIIDLELFEVDPLTKPSQLLANANEAGVKLMHRLFCRLKDGRSVIPMENIRWGPRKSTRKQFQELCRVECGMSLREFNRRLHATSMPGYSNLFIEIHGKRFQLMDFE